MTRLATSFAAASLAICGFAFSQAHDHSEHQEKPAAATTQPAKPVNTKCPVSGEAIDPAVTTTHEGKTIAFCCKDCIDDFKKNPEKYTKKLQ